MPTQKSFAMLSSEEEQHPPRLGGRTTQNLANGANNAQQNLSLATKESHVNQNALPLLNLGAN